METKPTNRNQKNQQAVIPRRIDSQGSPAHRKPGEDDQKHASDGHGVPPRTTPWDILRVGDLVTVKGRRGRVIGRRYSVASVVFSDGTSASVFIGRMPND